MGGGLLLSPLGCGARSAFDLPGAGGASATASTAAGGTTGSVGPATGTGGNGTGGSPSSCAALQWAGPALAEQVIGNINNRRPELVVTQSGQVAVTYYAQPASLQSVHDLAVNDPFTSWPPDIGYTLPAMSCNSYALSPGDHPLFFSMLVHLPGTDPWIGQVQPSVNGFFGFPLSLNTDLVHFMARSASGGYLLGVGSASVLDVRWLPVFAEGTPVEPLGIFGCAEQVRARVDTVPADGGFWIGSAVDTPDDDCLDPDLPGPALYAQAHHLTVGGVATFAAASKTDTPLAEVDIAALDAERAWLGFRAQGASSYSVQQVTVGGPEGEVFTIDGAGAQARHDLAMLEGNAVVARLLDTANTPGGDLDLFLLGPEGELVMLEGGDDAFAPLDGPALLVDAAQRSVLVAWLGEENGLPRVVLRRADCVAGP